MILNKNRACELFVFTALPILFLILHDDTLSQRELWARFVVVLLLSVAQWSVKRWQSPIGQPLGYKVCFAVFQGLFFGLWMALTHSVEGATVEPLVFLLVSGGIFGASMLGIQKGQPIAPPVPPSVWRPMAGFLAVGVCALIVMILVDRITLSLAGMVGAAVLLAVPQPFESALPKSGVRVRQAIGFLLILGFIAVKIFL